jgi:hypothetical protein
VIRIRPRSLGRAPLVLGDRESGFLEDAAPVDSITGIDQANRYAVGSSSTGPADPVYIGLDLIRNVVVHDSRDRLHIEAPRGDISGDQRRDPLVLEAFEYLEASILVMVAVE